MGAANLRRGLSRLARVSAWLYWIAGLWLVAGIWWSSAEGWRPNGSYGPMGANYEAAWNNAWPAAVGVIFTYVVLLALYRAVRWVLLGFIDPAPPVQ